MLWIWTIRALGWNWASKVRKTSNTDSKTRAICANYCPLTATSKPLPFSRLTCLKEYKSGVQTCIQYQVFQEFVVWFLHVLWKAKCHSSMLFTDNQRVLFYNFAPAGWVDGFSLLVMACVAFPSAFFLWLPIHLHLRGLFGQKARNGDWHIQSKRFLAS